MKQNIAARRDEILEKIIDVLLLHGISDLSLRPLAHSVGTSARLLMYHFGSKEQLLADALDGVRQRIDASVRALAVHENPGSLAEFLRMFWRWALKDSNQRYFRLLFEIDGLALHNRAKFPAHFWGAGFNRWIQFFEGAFGQLSRNGSASSGTSTFVLATLNGLLHDHLVTRDRKRTTDALNCLIEAISVVSPAPLHADKSRN